MPFAGRAHFVQSLDTFVGLSDDPDTRGHLCSCDSAPITGNGGVSDRPEWKVSKERIFSDDPNEGHQCATLLYMGEIGGSGTDLEWMCLVECVSIGDGEERLEEEDGYVVQRRSITGYCYRLTTFSLSYDGDGDLTTGESCRVRWYKVPEENGSFGFEPVVFWL
ncbi:hypothetical protein HU200_008835 [Digitaria exilis]|uniref:Uncharacterized protein n=1 Tax=Digitaria exilis TaxID=1010633 RepID=A0A835KRB6_9POAL|nr:hypothetical protein HU200_008835 [Digitaria exilis]